MNLSAVEKRAAKLPGETLWRSLDELAGTERFRNSFEREFPASYWDFEQDGTSRRSFLRLMGASIALAGLYGCSERPSGKILPYIQQPEQIVPGMPLYFASAMPINGYGHGVLAESHEGRPTKIEGNPDHPASRGATNVLMQASVLQLYDPERAHNVLRAGVVSSWEEFRRELSDRLDRRREDRDLGHKDYHEGRGIRILTGNVTSPTLAWQIGQLLAEFPQARIDVTVTPQYRNMAEGLKKEPRALAFAEEAMRRAGLAPKLTIVRGGTDGSRLTELGLPTPNLSCGEHNLHSPLEWTCLEEMATAVRVLVELAKVWGEAPQ